MLPDIADFLLTLALVLSVIQCIKRFAKAAAITSFLCVTTCFVILIYSFAVSDFTLKIVFENSHSAKPLLYKISGTWGNHEGSIMMLTWMLALFGAAYSLMRHNTLALSVQGGVCALFIAYTKFASNPFVTFGFAPPNGLGLNPVLQDVGLALHPPFLYLGYVGFSLVYSISIAYLWQEKVGKAYAQAARKWCLLTWSFLTIGIGLGSSWAYRELGWGGFWFWDPVENASLMPWLASTALLHSLIITEKRKALKKWTILLSIITFSLSLVGFFLVRSGILTSVHSFASDPMRGMFMLGILIIISGSGFLLFGLKSPKLKAEGDFSIVSREGGILFNNMILMTLAATIFVGTIYPLALEHSISVGAPYYNYTFVPIALILLVVCAIFPQAKWVSDNGRKLARKLLPPFIAAMIAGALLKSHEVFAIVFLAASCLLSLRGKKLNELPMFLAHTGIAALALGIFFVSMFDTTYEGVMKPGEVKNIAGYDIEFDRIETGSKDNYVYRRGIFFANGYELKPEMRVYPVERDTTNEAAIHTHYLNDLYIVIGEPYEQGFAVRIYHKPLMNLIWLALLVTAAGGFASLLIRLKRTG
jgi:cytochrome c-type biogenesis protein CcmF